jgi:hypothetical protein
LKEAKAAGIDAAGALAQAVRRALGEAEAALAR